MINYYTPEVSLSAETLGNLAWAEAADRAVVRARFDLEDALGDVERLEDEVRLCVAEGWSLGNLYSRLDAAAEAVIRAERRLAAAERTLRLADSRL
jgi:hypothetical protein